MAKVLIQPSTYDDVKPAVEQVFDLFTINLKGKKVLLKPNLLRGSAPEEGVVTHPAVLKAVVEKVESMAPESIVVGDNPGLYGYGINEKSFQQTGLMAAAKGYYKNIGNDACPVDFDPAFLPKVSLSRAILEADVVISLPKFKTHGLTVITGAIKNSYGFLPGAQKAMLHKAAGSPKKFHEVIAKVFALRVPDLFIMDAIVGMEGNGPASPDLRQIGVILAADNGVALDAVVAHIMACSPRQLPFLQIAHQMGLGEYDLQRIQIIGDLFQLQDYKLPHWDGTSLARNEAVQALLHSKTRLRPKADPNTCTACGTCIEQCPVGALHLMEDLPEVDAETCITCFCCQEVCPEKAIVLQ